MNTLLNVHIVDVIECAARLLANERPGKGHRFLRQAPVAILRAAWKMDSLTRASVINLVHAWLRIPSKRTEATLHRLQWGQR
jgi:hypothetical protein